MVGKRRMIERGRLKDEWKTRCTMMSIGQGLMMDCRVCGHRQEGSYIYQSGGCSNGCKMSLKKKQESKKKEV
jgi:hypothetical protein